MTPLFPLGQVNITPGALSALWNTGTSPLELLDRHVSGDWGQVGTKDARENQKVNCAPFHLP
jgi:hypothetical protein